MVMKGGPSGGGKIAVIKERNEIFGDSGIYPSSDETVIALPSKKFRIWFGLLGCWISYGIGRDDSIGINVTI
jgi:hypothetical protein